MKLNTKTGIYSHIGKGEKRQHRQEEYHLQVQVVQYLQLQYPAVRFNADCGGARYGEGLQAILRGKRMRAMGHSRGFPDLLIIKVIEFSDGDIYHGIAMELKVGKNRLSPDQKIWLEYLSNNGYKAFVCRSFDEAKKIIDDYLTGDKGGLR